MKSLYAKYYSESFLWEKLKNYSRMAGEKVVYGVLLLYYVMQDSKTGIKTKISIAAALGYFILPTDAILDLTPLIGFSDDLGVLMFMLSRISASITPEIRQKAKTKMTEWFGTVNTDDLDNLIEKME